MPSPTISFELLLGPVADATTDTLRGLNASDVVPRMWAGDYTVWQDDPTEVADRLGWMHVIDEMIAAEAELTSFAASVVADGFTEVVLSGMGGSSLFPEVLQVACGPRDGGIPVSVLDTTDPASVGRVLDRRDQGGVLVVVSSKSGSTIETRSHMDTMWERRPQAAEFVVVTDPGSELAGLAAERSYRAVFENRSDIGGRFSALSYFGLVPAALLGLPWADWLRDLKSTIAQMGPGADRSKDPALALGSAMAVAAREGRDKLTVELPDDLAPLGVWIEQLVAESTGKHGTGVVPVIDAAQQDPEAYASDRLFVVHDAQRAQRLADARHPVVLLSVDGGDGLFPLVFLWEMATAIAGRVLGLNPFDQPDVASAKVATNEVLEAGPHEIEPQSVASIIETIREGDHLAICAFVDPGAADLVASLGAVRDRLAAQLGVATTLGFGPRFLHSTGQLHKGGPDQIAVLQVASIDGDVPIPGRDYGFATLEAAQAEGDLEVLRARGRRAARVHLDELLAI